MTTLFFETLLLLIVTMTLISAHPGGHHSEHAHFIIHVPHHIHKHHHTHVKKIYIPVKSHDDHHEHHEEDGW
ncbi:hypothetical protein PUN28_013105 [Cardiocondyla obscurior]|uniref:Histidine-rich glycoprotein n=1 Tax=Cardiocondyla obscurior TaxID=286306 RepID=A0AAW2F899_9HYME